MTSPEWGTEDYRRKAVLFNDVTFAPTEQFVHFGTRQAITDYLWQQGWRRDVRPEDVTEFRRTSVTPDQIAEGDAIRVHGIDGEPADLVVDTVEPVDGGGVRLTARDDSVES